MSRINQKIPNFSVEAFHQNKFKKITSEDVKGHWSIFFFYPADFTFVCPTELGDMADQYGELQKINTEVYAVSTDTHFVHKAWFDVSETIAKIQFPMLGDPTGHMARSFGVMIEETGLALRGSFITNPEGIIKACEIHDLGIGRSAQELVRKTQAAQYIAEHSGEVCPAKWKPGSKTLTPGMDLVGKI